MFMGQLELDLLTIESPTGALNSGVDYHIDDILCADIFSFVITSKDREKFNTNDRSGEGEVSVTIFPENPIIEDTGANYGFPINIKYEFFKNNFIQGHIYGPNDRYDLDVKLEVIKGTTNDNLLRQLKAYMENIIRSEHQDTNGD